jgi:signal transduction histidine kinase
MARHITLSTRVRITVTTVLLLLAALVLGGIGLAYSVKVRQDRAVARTARADAAAVVALARRQPLPRVLPALAPGPFTLVQVVDASGQVIAAAPGLESRPPVVGAAQLGRGTSAELSRLPFMTAAQEMIVQTVPVTLDRQPATVVVVSSAAEIHRGKEAVVTGLEVGLPILGLIGAALAWLATGRALGPVEAMRRQAADITAHAMHMRIPTPPGDDELARLATTLNEMLERLDAATVEQRRFVADASHELRSPLTGIHTALEVAIGAEPPGDRRQLLDRLLVETRRVEALLDQLLSLALIDEHTPSRGSKTVDLSSLVVEEVHQPAPVGVTVTSDVADGIVVDGDADSLARVVRNLLSNAMRHATSVVSVRLSADTKTVRLVVTDDGPGVAIADRERIFDRFVRLDDHRGRSTGGAGLGLAIARDAVASHGGTIVVADREGGATLEVELPRRVIVS